MRIQLDKEEIAMLRKHGFNNRAIRKVKDECMIQATWRWREIFNNPGYPSWFGRSQ